MASKEPDKNQFVDEDEMEDFEFLNHPYRESSRYLPSNDSLAPLENLVRPNPDNMAEKRLELLLERKRIEERTLQSCKASLGLVCQSELIGVQTAEELMRQREQLQNVEYNVDEVNSSLRTSQKHLNIMKSFFGGIKSYFGGKDTPETTKASTNIYNNSPSNLTKLLDDGNMDQNCSHPSAKLRGISTLGFREEDDDQCSFSNSSPPTNYETDYRNYSAMVDQRLDSNLDELNLGLGRLKNLAVGLGDEIKEQNDTLDRLTGKVERADITLRNQNRQMNKILKNS